jgi:Flp pilus assembly protein TadG
VNRGRRAADGQSVTEFALVIPLLLLAMMILLDFGRVIYAQNAIEHDARAASRFASTSAPQSDAAIRDRARVMDPLVPLPDTAITGEGGSFYPDGTDEGQRVVVNIEVTVPLVTPFISTIVGGTASVGATAQDVIR